MYRLSIKLFGILLCLTGEIGAHFFTEQQQQQGLGYYYCSVLSYSIFSSSLHHYPWPTTAVLSHPVLFAVSLIKNVHKSLSILVNVRQRDFYPCPVLSCPELSFSIPLVLSSQVVTLPVNMDRIQLCNIVVVLYFHDAVFVIFPLWNHVPYDRGLNK